MRRRMVLYPNFSKILQESGAILLQNGNRLKLIGAWMIGLIFVPLYILLWEAFTLLPISPLGIDRVVWFMLAIAVLTLFGVMPYILGILGMARIMVNGEEAVLADVFEPFSSARAYGKALRVSFGLFWRLWLIFDFAAGVCYATAIYAPSDPFAALITAVLVVCEILFGLVMCLFDYARFWAEFRENSKARDAAKLTKQIFYAYPEGGMLFFLGYLPRIALGVLTFGIFLITDTLPRMCVSYFYYCDMMNERMIQLEGYTNE